MKKNKIKIQKTKKIYYIKNRTLILKKKRVYHKKHRAYILKRMREYYRKNRLELLKKAKIYQRKNKNKIRKQKKAFFKKHKSLFKRRWRNYQLKNRTAILRKKREHYCKNKKRIRKYQLEYQKRKLKADIQFRLANLLRTRLRIAIKSNQKSGSAVRDLGCPMEFFIAYIQSKFYGKMTWDNWGSIWELDHIKELHTFDLTKRSQLLKVVHYTNLRPLTIYDHRRKTNKERRKGI